MARSLPLSNKNLQQWTGALATNEIFGDLEPAALAAIARRCVWRSYEPGQPIMSQQDETREVHFIVAGRVRVNLYSPDGQDVTFRDLGHGEVVGELAAIDEAPRSANVIALEPTLTASLKAGEFSSVLRDHPVVAAAMLRRLVRLVRALTDRVYEFSTLAVRNRIHAELLRLCRDGMTSENAARIDPAPTHADIASRISTHREAVTRELNKLVRARVIDRDDHALVVRDVARLAHMVEAVGDP